MTSRFVALYLLVFLIQICKPLEITKQTDGNVLTTEEPKFNSQASWALQGHLQCGNFARTASVNFLNCNPRIPTCSSTYLETKGYGFQIPSNATISNIAVDIYRSVSSPYDTQLNDTAYLLLSSFQVQLTSYSNWNENGVFRLGIVSIV